LAVSALVVQRWRMTADKILHRTALALLATALTTAVMARVFFALTHGMQPYGGGVASMTGDVFRILGLGAIVLGPALLLAGAVFPLGLAGAGCDSSGASDAVGKRWGILLGYNAAGALVGLVLVDFVCMRAVGLWMSITLWALAATIAGLLLAARGPL